MIRPAADHEIDALCARMAEIDPWKILGLRGDELAHSLRTDPLKIMIVYDGDPGQPPAGVAILRTKSAAELLFFRGFGEILARHHGQPWPCPWTAIPDGGYVASLAALGGHTGRGIGQHLLDAAHRHFASAGHRFAYLTVSGFNARARQFYERNGYQCLGYLDNCLRPGNREYLMKKSLAPAPTGV